MLTGLPDDKLREEMGAWAEKLRAIELPGQQQHAPSTVRAFERVTAAADGDVVKMPEATSGRLYRARALLHVRASAGSASPIRVERACGGSSAQAGRP